MEIQRHCVCASGYGEGYLVPHPLGEAVEYDDHVEYVQVLKHQIALLLEQLEEVAEQRDDWRNDYYELLRRQ